MATLPTTHRRLVSGAALALIALIGLAACGDSREASEPSRTDLLVARAERQDVIVEVSATGVIEPIRIVEIKSKASGEILHMPVESGDIVSRNDLLAQVDTAEVATDLRQLTADLATRQAQLQIAERQLERSRDLLSAGMIAQDELDQALLEATTSRSNLIRAETELEHAQERRRDTIVRAPISGTVLSKSVEEGQIIASATSQVSDGTILMTMADLSRVQVRAMVDETEIGKVRAGQQATVRVDAFPGHPFSGDILKIEPEGIIERDITFFPVLIHIDNAERLLRPGMNATVDIHIDRRDHTVALTNDAVKTLPQAMQIAPMLGIEPDSIRSMAGGSAPSRAPLGERPPRDGMRPGGGGGGRGMRGDSNGSPRQMQRPEAASGAGQAVVFMEDSTGFRPVVVSTGIQNWSVTEITSGLSEGDEVIIPPSPLIAQQFEQFRERLKRWSSLPGQR